MIRTTKNDSNHLWETLIYQRVLLLFLFGPSVNIEEAEFMSYTAASQQGAIKMIWLPFWEAAMSSMFRENPTQRGDCNTVTLWLHRLFYSTTPTPSLGRLTTLYRFVLRFPVSAHINFIVAPFQKSGPCAQTARCWETWEPSQWKFSSSGASDPFCLPQNQFVLQLRSFCF